MCRILDKLNKEYKPNAFNFYAYFCYMGRLFKKDSLDREKHITRADLCRRIKRRA